MYKVFVACLAFAGLLAGPVSAAERNWSGFYVGGNAGYAWGHMDNTTTIADGPDFLNCHFCAFPFGGNDPIIAQNEGARKRTPEGFTGGVQFGYNWQSSHWVYGVEVDFAAFQQRQTQTHSFVLPNNTALVPGVCGPIPGAICVGNYATSVQTDWLLTVRPKIGFAWDQNLVYATGGLALTELRFSQTYTDNLSYPLVPGTTGAGGAVSMSASGTKVGFAVGGGFERAIADHWSFKLDYLYTQFGGLSASGRLTDGLTGAFGTFVDFSSDTGHFSSHVLRVGVNYLFDSGRRL
jgi:outer membrane immunogenic protein